MRPSVIDLLRLHLDRVVAVVCLAVGVLALILGYIGASDTPYVVEQIPYVISGGITGLLLLGVAATLYLSADLRDEWRKLDELHRDIAALRDSPAAGPGDTQAVLSALQRRVEALESADLTPAAASSNGKSVTSRSRRSASEARRG